LVGLKRVIFVISFVMETSPGPSDKVTVQRFVGLQRAILERFYRNIQAMEVVCILRVVISIISFNFGVVGYRFNEQAKSRTLQYEIDPQFWKIT